MTVGASSFRFAGQLRQGDVVAWAQGTGEPLGLTAQLMRERQALPRITLMVGMMTGRNVDAGCLSNFDALCLNGAGRSRDLLAHGARAAPIHVSDIPDAIEQRRLPVDVALVRVRPSDETGKMSLGVMTDYTRSLIAAARLVVGELDERMPLTGDDALIDRDAIGCVVEADGDDNLFHDATPTEVDHAVARVVAQIVPDGATLQFGIGALPNAVCIALAGHRELGLHSGILSDAAARLIDAGVVTNAHKGIDVGRSVTGGLFGSRLLMAHADGNRLISMRTARYTHAARTMAGINRLHSINSAIEVDLTGQINAEVAGSRYLGAVGGQVDFVRGSRLSSGGRSIIALCATTPDRTRSKIVASLDGRPVTTARADTDLVVTEFGVADLRGLDLAARARALIDIAHPDFREGLLRAAAGERVVSGSSHGVPTP